MTKILQIILIIFSFVLGCHESCIFAANPEGIGTVISVEGKATAINQANQQRALERRSTIYLHDRIVTQPESKVQFILRDDSVIVVQSASEFYVSEFAFNNNAPRNNKYVGNIVKGALINLSGRGETKNYRLDSPLVTMAFRGTGVATELIIKNNIAVDQKITVFQGYITVSNKCENITGKKCEPFHMDIGVGQKFNSATVNMLGVISGLRSSVLLEKSGATGGTAQTITTQDIGTGGGISIKCK